LRYNPAVAERQEVNQLIGEFLRDFAVLWAALYPLEANMQNKFDWTYCTWTYLAAAALMYLGVILEGEEDEA
jgi:hypothetical protein